MQNNPNHGIFFTLIIKYLQLIMKKTLHMVTQSAKSKTNPSNPQHNLQ